MAAKVLAYSRNKGLFAGIALEGAVLRPSGDDNKALYGREVSPRAILLEHTVGAPASAQPVIALLNKYSPTQNRRPL
jgi:lipid-binding SYLF domain-containing protein